MDLEGLLSAKPVVINRREGLPGQKPLVLDDALKGERSVWFRFSLRGGFAERVARVLAGKRDVTLFTQKPAGDDLRIVVQVPASEITKKTSMTIEFEGGRKYHFASLTTPTLTNLLNRF
jgi:hypothetical protein